MLKRVLKIMVIVFFLTILPFYGVCARENIDIEEENVNAVQKADELLSGSAFRDTLSLFVNGARESALEFTKIFSLMIFITFMLGIMRNLNAGNTAIYAGEICLCTFTFSVASTVIENIAMWLSSLEKFMLSMLPVMTSLYVTSGSPTAAAVSYTSTVLSLNICNTMFNYVIVPVIKCITFLSVMSFISRSFDFSGINTFVKNTLGQIFGLLMCTMSAVIAFQNIIAVSKDGVSGRAIRFAAARFIPVIGGTVSESARTVSQSLKLVRSVSGITGIFGIVGIIASPVASLLVLRFFINVCSAVARLFSEGKAASFFSELSGVMNLLLGAVVGVSLIFILILGMLAGSTITL